MSNNLNRFFLQSKKKEEKRKPTCGNENQRVKKEIQHVEKVNQRVENEFQRVENENQSVEKESQRVENENQRVENKNQHVENKNQHVEYENQDVENECQKVKNDKKNVKSAPPPPLFIRANASMRRDSFEDETMYSIMSIEKSYGDLCGIHIPSSRSGLMKPPSPVDSAGVDQEQIKASMERRLMSKRQFAQIKQFKELTIDVPNPTTTTTTL